MHPPCKILVIEDDEDLQSLVSDILSLSGYEVVTASDGVQGAAMAKSELPDCILCDMLMPEMNGMEVLRALRGDDATAGIPMVFTSAKADDDTIGHAREAGATGYLVKPFTRQELMDCVASLVPGDPR